jgi:hypothetical protein
MTTDTQAREALIERLQAEVDNQPAGIDTYYGRLFRAAIDALRQHEAGAQSGGVRVKPLEWSAPKPPNDTCPYNHIRADSPLGEWTIERKPWKKYDDRAISLNGSYVNNGGPRLETAQAVAQADYERRILSALLQPGAQSGGGKVERREQFTICDDCGKSDLYATDAVWTEDGSSFCPTCRTLTPQPEVKSPPPPVVTDDMVERMRADIDEFMKRLGPGWFLSQGWFPSSLLPDILSPAGGCDNG